MNCGCHDEPMRWDRDARYRAGGFWRCLVKERVSQRRRYHENAVLRERRLQKLRDRYDSDPIYRIEKQMSNAARLRANTLKRRREHLGSLPE